MADPAAPPPEGNLNPEASSSGSATLGTNPSTSSSTTTTSSSADTQVPQEYTGYNGDMRAYCKSLENWLWRAYWQREVAVSAYFTALSTVYPNPLMYNNGNVNVGFPQSTQNQGHPGMGMGFLNGGNNGMGGPPGGDANNNAPPRQVLLRGIRRDGNRLSFDFKIAPLWKRVLAECIDFFILLVVKVFVTLSIVDNFELIDLESIDLDALQESGSLMEVAYSLTSELLLLELTHRVVVCFFEAYCLYKGGATPGKSILGLRVLYCQEVYPVIVNPGDQFNNNNVVNVVGRGTRVLVSPGSFLTLYRALVRSIIKNFTLAFFFPICFSVFHFEHNRTLHDVVAKSIVVEIRQP
jgi:uncharacterized RDD family membrane protein YckC